MPISTVHYTLHTLFKGYFLSINNVEKNPQCLLLISSAGKIQKASTADPLDRGPQCTGVSTAVGWSRFLKHVCLCFEPLTVWVSEEPAVKSPELWACDCKFPLSG